MAIILDIPVERVVIKDKGGNVEVYKFRDFWRITETDVQPNTGVDMTGHVISNPLIPWHDVFRVTDPVLAQTAIYFRLVPTCPSNPGEDDNGPSLVFDDYII